MVAITAARPRRTSGNSLVSGRDVLMMGLGGIFSFVMLLVAMREEAITCASLDTTDFGGGSAIRSSTAATGSIGRGLSLDPQPAGWGPIHVYYGSMEHTYRKIPDRWWLKDSPNHQNGKTWFSQHGQDVAVAKVLNFKKDGYFVDLASNDAVWASNTFSLEQNFGWRGICIEPNPIYWYGLSFRKCHVVGSIVGAKDLQEVNVTLGSKKVNGPYGGIVGKDFDNSKAKDMEPRYTASLKSLLKRFGAPPTIDYLSLDVEGAEEYIMTDFPFSEYRFLTMTVERPSENLQKILKDNGYLKAMDIARGDTLWAHNSIYEQAKAALKVRPEEIKEHAVDVFPPGIRD